ncbi:MAG: putative capsid protein [Cressdnaviricota sp.]|nr:MAG: putative capsid protein [Cressdnaviricota sp.]
MAYVRKTGMRSKRTYRRRPRAKTSKKGLTKTEKTQVKQIAKKVTNSLAESKYFATSGGLVSMLPSPVWKTAAIGGFVSEITTLAFTTGFNREKNLNGSIPYFYGKSIVDGSLIPMTELNLNRIFTDSDPVPVRRQSAIEGNLIRPSYAECKWLLERPQSTTTGNPLTGLPYTVRMIRVRPKSIKGAFQKVDPNLDLFLDQYNESFGVGTNNLTSSVLFNKQAFYMSKVNNRLYHVIEDKMFNVLPSSCSSDLGLSAAEQSFVVTQPNNTGNKCWTTRHNIGKELYYNEPNVVSSSNDDRQYPQTGFENEFVLFHFIGQGSPPLASGVEGDIGTADNIRLSARPVSTFKDI